MRPRESVSARSTSEKLAEKHQKDTKQMLWIVALKLLSIAFLLWRGIPEINTDDAQVLSDPKQQIHNQEQ